MNANLKSLPENDAQRQARIDLAAAYQLAAHFGLNEGIDNHLTLMVPGCSDRFYLAPFGLHWSEVKASDLLVLDYQGQIVGGNGLVEETAQFIHTPVHRLSPHGTCVLHTHQPYATALSMLEDATLEMSVQTALGFHDEIAYVDYNGLAYDAGEGERLARALGAKTVLMLRNHGVLTVGKTLPLAFERLYFMERAAQAQILALSTGRALKHIPDEVVRKTAIQFNTAEQVSGKSRPDLHFDALKRLLDRQQSDYAG